MADMVSLTCPVCGIDFSAPERFIEYREKHERGFRCPNGHRLAQLEDESETTDDTAEQLAAARRVIAVKDRRIAVLEKRLTEKPEPSSKVDSVPVELL